jgi:hypothetical protein
MNTTLRTANNSSRLHIDTCTNVSKFQPMMFLTLTSHLYHGHVQWGSPAAYLRNVWGWLDIAVVADGILGLAWPRGNGTWSSCIRVMRVMRICHRIPQLEVGSVINYNYVHYFLVRRGRAS